MRVSGFLGVLAILACGLLDPFWMPEQAGALWQLRILTAIPVLGILAICNTSIAKAHMQPIIALCACLFMACVVGLSLRSAIPFNYFYAASISIVMLAVFVLTRLQFIWGLPHRGHHAGHHQYRLCRHRQGRSANAHYGELHCLVSALFSLVGTFLIERSLRQNYLQARLLAFENHDLGEANLRLQYLTAIDGLTRIANRRSLDMSLITEWQRAMRKQEPLGVVMIDVDHFTLFNDTYGQLAGDDCLRNVAGALSSFARRPGDLVARYGGEEFALILTNANPQQAKIVAERVRDNIQDLGIPNQRSSVGNVTVSLGVASIIPSQHMSGPEVLLLAADQALSRAKRGGRNRVVVDGEPDTDAELSRLA
jgi:diguanylate cyclase (GGDEF)-like protein